MNAGTAQKIVLNVLTTAAMARAGRVHGDLMVDVRAGQRKLAAAAGRGRDRGRQNPRQTGRGLQRNARAAVLRLAAADPAAAHRRPRCIRRSGPPTVHRRAGRIRASAGHWPTGRRRQCFRYAGHSADGLNRSVSPARRRQCEPESGRRAGAGISGGQP